MKSMHTGLNANQKHYAPPTTPSLLSTQQLCLVSGGAPLGEIFDRAMSSAEEGAKIGSIAGYVIRGTIAGATRGGLSGAALGFAAGAGFGIGTVVYNYFSGGGRRYRSKTNIV